MNHQRLEMLSSRRTGIWLPAALLVFHPLNAHASFLEGDALDTMANVISWGVLFIVPTVVVSLFWFVHILPEKIARKRQHPQEKAIQCLCLLSLVFGGLLWPIALLWAYTKPVLYKMAYGTDTVPHEPQAATVPSELPKSSSPDTALHPATPEGKA